MKLLLITLVAAFLITSCKKDKPEPPLNASMLTPGRAGIKFTTDQSFNGSTTFDVANTSETSAINKPLTTMKNITIEATEVSNNTMTRKAYINIVVPINTSTANGVITIDLSKSTGQPPLAYIRLESYSLFGVFRTSTSGTLTITKLTSIDVEGSFDAVAEGQSTVMRLSGSFAGKFL